MTLLTRASDISFDAASAMYAPQRSGLEAGEALDAFACCYIKQSDGKVYMSNATSANEAASFDGMTVKSYASGDTMVTLFGLGTKIRYGSSLTPGATYYIGATAGRLDTAATTGDGQGIARAVTASVIRITRDAVNGAGGITDLSIGTADIAAGAVTFAKAAVFISAETTGTGSSQNVAHGLGATPAGVLVVPTEHPGTPDTGAFDIAEGTHTSTNVVVTVTANVKFKVMAWA